MDITTTLPGAAARAEYKEKFGKLFGRYKWLAIPAVLLLGPVSYFIAYALFGATLALGAGSLLIATWLVIVNLWPKWAMQLANYKLKALKEEAERNPIETLQNQQTELERRLMEQSVKITSLDTGVENYRTYLVETARTEPEAAAAGIPTLRNMEKLLIFRRMKWQAARVKLTERSRKIKSADAKYKVALQARELTKVAGEPDDSVLQGILESVAFGAVESTVNESMAALRTAVMVESIPEGEIIDIQMSALPAPSSTNLADLMSQLQAPEEVKAVRHIGVSRVANGGGLADIEDIQL